MKQIKFSDVDITKSDLKKVNEVLESGWLTHGKYTKLFENQLTLYTKSKYATTVSSCTAGLHLIFLALGIGKGDTVLVPAMSHVATAHAISYTGANVKFTDVDLETGNITLEDVIKNFNKNIKAIVVVHMSGIPVRDILKIKNFCKKNKIYLIEDCAHALGSKINGKHVGNFGDAGSFSFYPTKQITSGEGGAVITNNSEIFNKIKKLKAFGIDTDIKHRKIPGMYNVKGLGYNFRMTDFQAALIYAQLKRYKNKLLIRKRNAKIYENQLKNHSQIKFSNYSDNNSYFIFQIFVNKKIRNYLLKCMVKKSIGCSIHYATPLPYFDYYKKIYGSKKYINAENYAKSNISLPIHSKLNSTQIRYISNFLINITK